jgi:shikimate kinase
MSQRSIALIGFMGCGKSSVAMRLSAALSLPLVEMDTLVCQHADCTDMNALFAKGGEPLLRNTEWLVAQKISHPAVISTGGGSILNPQIPALFKRHGSLIVFLHADFSAIAKRLRGDHSRPLLSKARELYAERLPLYKQYADLIIDTAHRSVDTISYSILEALSHGV